MSWGPEIQLERPTGQTALSTARIGESRRPPTGPSLPGAGGSSCVPKWRETPGDNNADSARDHEVTFGNTARRIPRSSAPCLLRLCSTPSVPASPAPGR
eukprot:7063010-Alexandrium_andersonii.AAC.1